MRSASLRASSSDSLASGRGAAEYDGVPLGDPPRVHLLKVLLHDHRALDEQPGHADDVGAVLVGGLEDRVDRLLDPDVDHGITVVRQDDVDEVLADVVHIALDGGEHDRALTRAVGLLHVGFEVRDGRLHHLGRLQHERQLHLAGPEQVADGLHAGQQRFVDDLQCGTGQQGFVQVGLEAVALTVDDAPLQPLVQR